MSSLMRAFSLSAVILVAVTTTSPVAASWGQCSATKAANELADCHDCHLFKDLLTTAKSQDLQLEVFELEKGVLVQLTGHNEKAVGLIHETVDSLWETKVAAEDESRCDGCASRHEKLAMAVRDRALTPTGAIVVLTSEDEQVVNWLRDDARKQRSFVQSVASAD